MDIERDIVKSYYAIIPATVRYDKNLTANAKLLYGEITALCNEKGYCWAKNEYFAELYGTSEKTITRWINDLKNKNYIDTELKVFRYEDGTVKKVRYIFIDKNVFNQSDKNVSDHMDKNVPNHTDKNVPYNNTLNNNTKNNNKRKYIYYGEYQNVFFTEEQYTKLIDEFPNDYNSRIDKLDCYMQSTGKKYKDCLATIRNWARNEKGKGVKNGSIKKSDGSEFAEFS